MLPIHRSHPLSEPDRRPSNLAPATVAQWVERAALADMYSASPIGQRLRGAFFVERRGAVIGYGAPGVDSLMLNRVFVGGEGDVAAVADVQAVVDRFVARGVDRFFVHVHESDQTTPLTRALAARGLVPYRRAWLKLMRGPGALPKSTTDLVIASTTHDQADDFARIAVQCMDLDPAILPVVASLIGRPGWHAYTAWDGGVPVAVGMLLVRGDVGYLNFTGTLPAWRRRGAQTALLDKRMRVAFALGCRCVVADTEEAIPGSTNSSLHNMLRFGMQVIGRRDNFVREAITWR